MHKTANTMKLKVNKNEIFSAEREVQHYQGKKLLIMRRILPLETTHGYQKLKLCVAMPVP